MRRLPRASLPCTWALVALVMGQAGCGDQDPGDVAVDEATSAVAASFDMVGVSDSFAASDALAGLPVGLARARALLDARVALLASVRDRGCVTVETDEETYIEVTYDACPAGLFRLTEIDGSLRAELGFETAPCGLAQCPTAVRFTLSTPYLRIGSRIGPRFTELVDGAWDLHDPVAPGAPTTWVSEYSVRNHLRRSLSLRSRASWAVEDTCASLDLEAQLQVRDREDLQVVAASARGVRRCAGQCPSAGAVRVAYGRGEVLGWTYTGMDTALVTGPRGRSFEVALPCGEDE